MRELEGDGLVVSATFCCLQLETELVELDREELDRHITVECLRVCPALHTVFVRHLLVHTEECVQLVIVDMSVLECYGVHYIVDAREDLTPLSFVRLDGYCVLLGESCACCAYGLLAVDPRGDEYRQTA